MKRSSLFIALFIFFHYGLSTGQLRPGISFPDILGYKTLTCDLHTHTIFSDGVVWPTVRVDEAFQEGLDVISITDHIENTNLYRFKEIFNESGNYEKPVFIPDRNLTYELASELAEKRDILLIKGGEISRTMPPGHHNAIFLKDINKLDTPHPQWKEAFIEAKNQGAFISWNHPESFSQPVTSELWWEEHTWLLDNGMMHGIEVVNGGTYYPEAHQWAIDKNLTILANTDVHGLIAMSYRLHEGERRAMTLVFVKERSVEGVKEALFDRRTLAYYDNKLIGNSKFLDAVFFSSVTVESVERKEDGFQILLHNLSDVSFELSRAQGNDPALEFFGNKVLPAGKQTIIRIYTNAPSLINKIDLKLTVDNLLMAPAKGLPVTLTLFPK